MKRALPVTLFFVFIVIPIGAGVFYWYEYRPSKIRQECSWVRKTSEAKPGRAAMTEDELRAKGMIKDCSNIQTYSWLMESAKYTCNDNNWKLIQEYKVAIPPEPSKEWWEEAEDYEYEF